MTDARWPGWPFPSTDPRVVPQPADQPEVQPPQFPATLTVHTPSGPTHACEQHADKIVGLMQFMGTHAALTAAPEGAQCANCINEARS